MSAYKIWTRKDRVINKELGIPIEQMTDNDVKLAYETMNKGTK